MRDAKRRNGRGSVTAEVVGPVDFAVGGGKSRAAARMLAVEREREAQQLQCTRRGKEPWRDRKPKMTMSVEPLEDGGKLLRFRFTPEGMSAAEMRRWREQNQGTGDSG